MPHWQYYMIGRTKTLEQLPLHNTDEVFVGDSETQYFELFEILRDTSVRNRGIQDETTAELKNRIPSITKDHPRKIFLETGVNDLLDGLQPDSIINNVSAIVHTIKTESPDTEIYIESIFPSKRVDNKEVLKYNAGLKKLCEKESVQFIDLYPDFNDHGALKYDCGDELHLNGLGYLIWADKLKPFINVTIHHL